MSCSPCIIIEYDPHDLIITVKKKQLINFFITNIIIDFYSKLKVFLNVWDGQ